VPVGHGVQDDTLDVVVVVQDGVPLRRRRVASHGAAVPGAVALPEHLPPGYNCLSLRFGFILAWVAGLRG